MFPRLFFLFLSIDFNCQPLIGGWSVSTGLLLRRLHFNVASVIPNCLSTSREPATALGLCNRTAHVEPLLGAAQKAQW